MSNDMTVSFFFFYQNVSLLFVKVKVDVRRSNKYLRFDNVGVYLELFDEILHLHHFAGRYLHQRY